MFDPTRPDKNRDKLYDFLNMNKVVFAMAEDLQGAFNSNCKIYEDLVNQLEEDDIPNVDELEARADKLQEIIGKEKAVLDQLRSKQSRDIVRNIAYEEFMQVCSGHEEEDYNLAESIHRLAKVGDNTIKRFSQMHKDMLK